MVALTPDAVVCDRYRLVRVVGRGGMGTVWEALNTWTERRVALKVMDRDGASSNGTASPERVERFLREAKATARVRHPSVVDVLDMGNAPDGLGLYIVYEFLDGEPLRALLDRRGALPPDEALALVTPAMEGVAEAHRCGVIHRDLKPENIVLARDAAGRVTPRVIDFGIARTDDRDASITRTGEVIGTARYMAPEQCRGARDLDARVDVWAFGVILFEALTGRAPFAGDGYHETLAAILTTDAPRLQAVRPELPDALCAAVDRALARDRDARHPTMRALLDALAAPSAHGAAARADTIRARAAAVSVAPSSVEPAVIDAHVTARAKRRLPAAAALAVLAALTLATLRRASTPARSTARPTTAASAPSNQSPRPTVTAPSPPPIAAPSPPAASQVSPPVVAAPRAPSSSPRPRHVVAPRPLAASAPPPAPRLPNGAPVLEP